MTRNSMTGRRFLSALSGLAVMVGLPGLTSPAVAQQDGRIEGTVIEGATRRPVEGAQVLVVGTNRAVVTNERGRFTLVAVGPGEVAVEFRRLGYAPARKTVSLAPGGTATVDFEVAASVVALDEVVVTGTAGGARAREVGSAIATVEVANIQAAPIVNIEQALGGRAAGVTVMGNSGQPGAGGTIRLRGNNSITQGNQPLIYVDGVRIYSGYGPTTGGSMQAVAPLKDIKPSDIDRIEIVKGPAATTLYGTEASGGVIQIFTKKGQAGSVLWDARVTLGANHLGHFGPKSDPTGLTFVKCTGPELVDSWGNSFTDVTCPASGSWLRNGMIQRYDVGVRGGEAQLSYALGMNYRDEEGVIPTGWSKDGGAQANFQFTPSPTLSISFTNNFNKRTTRWVPEGNRSYSFILNVARGPYGQFKSGGNVANGEILNTDTYDRTNHFISGFTIDHRPFDRLSHRFTVGYDYNVADASYTAPLGFQRYPDGYLEDRRWRHTTWSLDYVANFRTSLGHNLSSVSSAGGQLFQDENRQTNITVQQFVAPDVVPTLTVGSLRDIQSDEQLRVINAGFFLQQVLGLKERFFVTAGLRVDGNSAFGKDFGLQPYPKISASYVLSDHGFWPRDLIETMKLRAALGEAGKAPGAFDATRSWRAISADKGRPAFTPGQLGNPDLGPERTREIETGFDASALGGRVGLGMTYYHAKTLDALIPVLPMPSLGFSSAQLENKGTLQNKGFEALLDLGLVQNATVDWSVQLNFSTTQSKALDLGGQDILVSSEARTWVREGYPVPAFFGEVIQNPDEFAEPIIQADQFIGPVYPTKTVGITTAVNLFKRVTLDVFGEYQGGAYNENATGWLNARRGIWQPCYAAQAKERAMAAGDASALNDVTALERRRCTLDIAKGNQDWWVEPTSFFRLRTVSLAVDLPTQWVLGARSARLTLAATNLFTATDYTGLDPEMTDSGYNFWRREYYNMPQYQSFTASFRVTF